MVCRQFCSGATRTTFEPGECAEHRCKAAPSGTGLRCGRRGRHWPRPQACPVWARPVGAGTGILVGTAAGAESGSTTAGTCSGVRCRLFPIMLPRATRCLVPRLLHRATYTATERPPPPAATPPLLLRRLRHAEGARGSLGDVRQQCFHACSSGVPPGIEEVVSQASDSERAVRPCFHNPGEKEKATMSTPGRHYNVGGVLLPRPFKIRRLGHFASTP